MLSYIEAEQTAIDKKKLELFGIVMVTRWVLYPEWVVKHLFSSCLGAEAQLLAYWEVSLALHCYFLIYGKEENCW